MKFDLLHILKNFAVVDERLVRKLADGRTRPVTLVDRGRLVSILGGVRYYGPEVAYACIYRAVPMFPIAQVDGDAFNMSEDNLMPARLKKLRYRAVLLSGGYQHPLRRMVFPDEGTCHRDWVRLARSRYQEDKPYVRQLEDTARGALPKVPEQALRPYARKVRSATREGRPEAVEGRVWHFWRGKWLSLPEPVHESDDWMVRAAVVEVSPEARFIYDPLVQRTVSVVAVV